MQINQTLSPFEAQVLQLLTELRVKMDDLAGTTNIPGSGRIPLLESRLTRLTIAVIGLLLISGAAAYPHATSLISWLIK